MAVTRFPSGYFPISTSRTTVRQAGPLYRGVKAVGARRGYQTQETVCLFRVGGEAASCDCPVFFVKCALSAPGCLGAALCGSHIWRRSLRIDLCNGAVTLSSLTCARRQVTGFLLLKQ